jgi:uncharacterized protein YlxW (UPF0749 family)
VTQTRSDRGAPNERPPPDASMSLLNHLLSHTLDEDYAPVAERRRGSTRDHTPGGLLGLMTVLVLFGMLIVTMVLETNRAAPAVQEERDQLIAHIHEGSQEVEALRDRATSLQNDVARLEDRVLSRSHAGQSLESRLRRLSVLTGVTPVTGPGMLITVDDAPNAATDRSGQVLDSDLQKLVNALWVAGAEAVSIDGQRITSRTAIRGAGSAITVNYRSLTTPYVIRAVGNPDTLPARLLETEGGRAWLDLQVNFGITFTTETTRSMTVPGRAPFPTRFAHAPGGAG